MNRRVSKWECAGMKSATLIMVVLSLLSVSIVKSVLAVDSSVTNGMAVVKTNGAEVVVGLMSNGWNNVRLNRIAKERFAEGIRIEGKIKSIDDVTHSITVQTTTKPSLEVFAYIGRPYRNGMEELKIGEKLVLEGKISAVNSFGENMLVLEDGRPEVKK